MKPYCENIIMPYDMFPIKSFITTTMDYMIEAHPHWHSAIEILYFKSGYAKQQVKDNIFTANEGDLIIIGKDQVHSTYSFGKSKCEVLVIQFNPEEMFNTNINTGIFNSNFSSNNEALFNNPIKSDTEEGKIILSCIIEIHNELTNKKTAYESMVGAELYKITGTLSRYCLYKVNQVNQANLQNIRKMLERTFKLIDEGFFEEIPLTKAAAASNLSVTHFCRLFKKATGMTFNEYLTLYRVNKAERMLKSQKKISEIAMECGFGSISAFIRNFKKYKKCLPSKFK